MIQDRLKSGKETQLNDKRVCDICGDFESVIKENGVEYCSLCFNDEREARGNGTTTVISPDEAQLTEAYEEGKKVGREEERDRILSLLREEIIRCRDTVHNISGVCESMQCELDKLSNEVESYEDCDA